MKGKDTQINIAGVFRCCVQSVLEALREKDEFTPGETVKCRYCSFESGGMRLGDDGVWKSKMGEKN